MSLQKGWVGKGGLKFHSYIYLNAKNEKDLHSLVGKLSNIGYLCKGKHKLRSIYLFY